MNIEKVINEPSKKEFKGKKIKKALVASMLALTLATPSASQSLKTSDAASKPTVKMYGQKNVTTYTGDSIKLGKVVGKYKGKKLAKKKLKVTVKKESISYPAIANKIKNNKPVTFNSTGTYDVKYKFTSPAKTTKTATRQITVADEKYKNAPKNSEGLIVLNDDLSKYADYETITVNGNKYNIVRNLMVECEEMDDEFGNLLEYNYGNYKNEQFRRIGASNFVIGLGSNSPYRKIDNLYLQLVGKIKIKNSNFDYSNNILIIKNDKNYTENYKNGSSFVYYYFAFVDENGKLIYDPYSDSCATIIENNFDDISTNWFIREIDQENDKYQYIQYNKEEEIMIAPPIKEDTLVNGKKLTLNRKKI